MQQPASLWSQRFAGRKRGPGSALEPYSHLFHRQRCECHAEPRHPPLCPTPNTTCEGHSAGHSGQDTALRSIHIFDGGKTGGWLSCGARCPRLTSRRPFKGNQLAAEACMPLVTNPGHGKQQLWANKHSSCSTAGPMPRCSWWHGHTLNLDLAAWG